MDRAKRARTAEPVLTADVPTLTSNAEFSSIQQSQCQLAYLQAKLAATESLYAAYQAAVATARPARQVDEDGLVTFSDIEEEVLLQPGDADPQQHGADPQGPGQEAQGQQQGPGEGHEREPHGAAAEGTRQAAQDPAVQPGPDAAPGGAGGGQLAGTATVGPAPTAAAGPTQLPAAAGPGDPNAQRLLELEAVCSAVSAGDMEAQGER
ncbi:hypothetical protein GPECTOR_9g574 [Gonium pectorale]|uniref:Uncharacterized protein n=1 Tax=Gonium pectorale TaxID=33097 RepID=A0A150GT68_GONPE|nr:hypothetical protein GPECTOR_9g574 [Gonium pectorale]|eukprot:KXZ52530.1 hypothetical protein GPECTOR_9g574 [Gonium pectorale]